VKLSDNNRTKVLRRAERRRTGSMPKLNAIFDSSVGDLTRTTHTERETAQQDGGERGKGLIRMSRYVAASTVVVGLMSKPTSLRNHAAHSQTKRNVNCKQTNNNNNNKKQQQQQQQQQKKKTR
jgi:hypothetical protein